MNAPGGAARSKPTGVRGRFLSPSPHHSTDLRRRLLIYPASGVLAVVMLAAAMWSALPERMVTHWGAGGADGWMPRAWAVGLPVGLSLAGMIWAVVDRRGRRTIKQACEADVVGGLFAWLGVAALAASIWAPHAGMFVAWIVLAPVVLTGFVVWLANRTARRGRR